MDILKLTFAIGIASTLISCSAKSDDGDSEPAQPEQLIAQGTLALLDGTTAGNVEITSDGEFITLTIDAVNLPAGSHGFHLHETGTCDGPDFKSAGGHLNPLEKSHGHESANGSHLGDLPNLEVGGGLPGSLNVTIDSSATQFTDWAFDDDGTAVVIHAGPDDYKTDPSGDAGGRIACGVLER